MSYRLCIGCRRFHDWDAICRDIPMNISPHKAVLLISIWVCVGIGIARGDENPKSRLN